MKEVLDIPLSKSPIAKDKQLWPYAQSGSYSVKQGYKLLYKEMEDRNHINKANDIHLSCGIHCGKPNFH